MYPTIAGLSDPGSQTRSQRRQPRATQSDFTRLLMQLDGHQATVTVRDGSISPEKRKVGGVTHSHTAGTSRSHRQIRTPAG